MDSLLAFASVPERHHGTSHVDHHSCARQQVGDKVSENPVPDCWPHGDARERACRFHVGSVRQRSASPEARTQRPAEAGGESSQLLVGRRPRPAHELRLAPGDDPVAGTEPLLELEDLLGGQEPLVGCVALQRDLDLKNAANAVMLRNHCLAPHTEITVASPRVRRS